MPKRSTDCPVAYRCGFCDAPGWVITVHKFRGRSTAVNIVASGEYGSGYTIEQTGSGFVAAAVTTSTGSVAGTGVPYSALVPVCGKAGASVDISDAVKVGVAVVCPVHGKQPDSERQNRPIYKNFTYANGVGYSLGSV